MAKVNKRWKNPGTVDNWLDSLGLYRKNVAYDETCLFRAVSEQLFDCQIHHERVRKECIAYARENFEDFYDLVRSEEEWWEHLDLLEKHMALCGNIEINIISKKYSRDIIIYEAATQEIYKATNNNFPSTLRLCLMDEGHYDVVCDREHIMTAGFCQSIIYKILYENVFEIPKVDEIVNAMLYEKNTIMTQAEAEVLLEREAKSEEDNNESVCEKKDGIIVPIKNNIAPFPFKVAKALDPTIYRNIEYDSWGEVRREMRLGEWYYGDDKLILGTKCILNDRNAKEMFECYIQEIMKDQNKCVVYLTKLAEKRIVKYSDLSPESNAKPWPLPYRFAKNLVISGTSQAAPIEKTIKNAKRRNKDKRRTKSTSESTSVAAVEVNDDVHAYVGAPLHMHNLSSVTFQKEEPRDIQSQLLPSEEEIFSSDSPTLSRYHQWDQSHWSPILPPTPDATLWPQTPTTPHTMFNFNVRHMVASAPATPDVVPYHDTNYPYYLNYQVDPFQSYNPWQPRQLDTTQPPPRLEIASEDILNDNNETASADNEGSLNTNPFLDNENGYEHPPIVTPPMRPTLCTNIAIQNTPVEMFSPVIAIPPGTPVIYTPAPSEIPEMIVPSPQVMYTPPVDVQYVPQTHYVYPPTPPATWYQPGVTGHGFIFPSRPQ